MDQLPSVFVDLIAKDGWRCLLNSREGAAFTQTVEKNGLQLTYARDRSDLYYIVGSENGGWANLSGVLARVGIASTHDMQDFRTAADNGPRVQAYLDSPQLKIDQMTTRHEGMEKLRDFQRSIGAKESWLAGEEDGYRFKATLAERIRGSNGLKYWVAAAICLAYLVCKIVYPNAELPLAATMLAGFAIVIAGLYAMRRQNKI